MKELYDRFWKESPRFFTKVQKFGGWLSGVGIAMVGIPSVIPGDPHLDLFVKIGSYVTAVGITITAVSKLPVNDSDKEVTK